MGCLLGFALGDKACGMCRIVASIGVFMEWQPIGTAPKNGAPILTRGGQTMKIRRWVRNRWEDVITNQVARPTPTHWRPIPAQRKD